jgi:hypothetical protein
MPFRILPRLGKRLRDTAQRLPRRTGRLTQQALTCNLGQVLDISAGGMRVITKRVPRRPVNIQLAGHALPGPLTAVTQWSKRKGFFCHEVGLKFENVTPQVAKHLTNIACGCRLRAAA